MEHLRLYPEAQMDCNFDCKIQKGCRMLLVVSFVCSTFLLPILIYLVVAKSHKMQQYRWYLLNTILWCYVHHFCAFLTHPNPKYPSTCILFHPLIFTSQNQTILLFYIAIFSYINLGLSIICSMLYRFGQAYSMWSADYFEKSRSVYVLYFGFYVLAYVTILLPIVWGQEWSWEKTRVQFEAENPTLVAYFNHPMLCFVHEHQVRALHLYMAILLIVVFVIGNILYVLLVRMLHKSNQNSFLNTTHRLQVMLFRAFRVQLFIAYAFILLPLIFQALLIHYRYEHSGTVTTVVISLLSVHGTVDSLTMIYFISPWRRTVRSWINRRGPSAVITSYFIKVTGA